MSTKNAREIDLGSDFGDVIVKANGSAVEISADGSIHGLPGPANDSAAKQAATPQVGDEMPDGTIYAGVSPDTGDAMYVTPHDAPRAMTFNNAFRYVATLDAHSHKDWRLPSVSELRAIYQNCHKGKLKGTFNESSDSVFAHWYWSHTQDREDPSDIYAVDFTGGGGVWNLKDDVSLSFRPLRTEPRP